MTAPAFRLRRLAGRFSAERALGRLLTGGAAGLLLAGVAHRSGIELADAAWWVPAGAAAGILAGWIELRRRPVDAEQVARHLDRVLPELEESATLLLQPADRLGLLARRQQARVAQRWDPDRAGRALPRRPLRRSLLLALPGAALGLLLLLLPRPARGLRYVAAGDGSGASLTLSRVRVQITPPEYTGAPRRQLDAGDLEAEEGSQLTWILETAGAVEQAWLLTSAGDSARFRPGPPGRWQLSARAERSQLVRIRLTGTAGLVLSSDDYRVAVRPDKPPTLTLVRPEERTTLEPGALPPVAVELLAGDDYGVDSVAMAVTIASGRGEAVRFRRLRLPFASRERRPNHAERLRAALDLAGLGLSAGDELYFHVEATDRRSPVPNRSRSATVFISVRDTAEVVSADLARIAIGAQPEYFRSQRQIVIDTEKLLAEERRLSATLFRDRSNELGIDQGLLRLRYGQFLGEEFEEEESAPMGGREHAAAEAAAEPPKLEDQPAGAEAQGAARKEAGELAHKHDDAENATLLGASIKDKLRAAVSAMWQAELHLRTGDPKRALPYELRALEFIKAVQQDARVYVQRVGFEPPPLEVAKLRLTGKLTGIADQEHQAELTEHRSFPAVRAALAAVRGLALQPAAAQAVVARDLELAGQELAGPAVEDPRLLPALRDLRQLADSLRRGAACTGCAARVEQGLWRALPPPEPRAATGPSGQSPVADRFAALLAGRRR